MNAYICDNGQDGFRYLLEAIAKAESSIEIQMFIWRDDPIGQRVGMALLEAADRGVVVTIYKDRIGGIFEYAEEVKKSFLHPKLPLHRTLSAWLLDVFYPMQGKPHGYRQDISPVAARLLAHPQVACFKDKDLFNHSKYYLIDQRHLIISGMNIEYKEWQEDLLGRPYLDFLMGIDSKEMVQSFKAALAAPGPQRPERDLDDLFNRRVQWMWLMNRKCQKGNDFAMRPGLIHLIQSARGHIDIVMAYIGDPELMLAIAKKANEGVKVKVFLPANANLQDDLNRKHAQAIWRLCGGKIDIYLHRHMIHGKLICIDRRWLSFGSCNFNTPAMDRLLETNICYGLDTFKQENFFEQLLVRHEALSKRVTSPEDLTYKAVKALFEGLIQ